jgi:hypothetical protein
MRRGLSLVGREDGPRPESVVSLAATALAAAQVPTRPGSDWPLSPGALSSRHKGSGIRQVNG